jgi:hypothetical protein
MITAKADVLVFEEIDRVYQFVALDFVTNYPRWSPEVVSLEPLSVGPVQVGFQARQVRVDQGHKSESVFEVAELEPLKRVCFKGVSAPFRSIYEFDDRSSSTFADLHLRSWKRWRHTSAHSKNWCASPYRTVPGAR